MKKYLGLVAVIMVGSFLLEKYANITVDENLISTILTVFSIIFGFYITSFAVFATSKYLSRLYEIEDEKDNRKTLLDNLLDVFSFATYLLLLSIIFLVVDYVFVLNDITCLTYGFWGVVTVNLLFACITIRRFIEITRKSAIHSKENEK